MLVRYPLVLSSTCVNTACFYSPFGFKGAFPDIMMLNSDSHDGFSICMLHPYTDTLMSHSTFLYKRIKSENIKFSYSSLHSNSCCLKLLVPQSKLTSTRKFTLRYQ